MEWPVIAAKLTRGYCRWLPLSIYLDKLLRACSAMPTPAFLDAFAQAWNRHDVEALLAMVTDDAVFETAAGPAPSGQRHAGKAALRGSFSAVWKTYPDASWNEVTHVISGDRGFSEWTFRGTTPGGEQRVEVRGVDVFTFRDRLIVRKDTFRKNIVTLSRSSA